MIKPIDELIQEGENLIEHKIKDYFLGPAVPLELFEIWKRKSLMYLQKVYPNHPQVKTFEFYVSKDNRLNNAQSLIIRNSEGI